jgi:hypothetical protein
MLSYDLSYKAVYEGRLPDSLCQHHAENHPDTLGVQVTAYLKMLLLNVASYIRLLKK